MFNIFATIAEFERELISERTKAGLDRARKLGRTGGRPKGITAESKRKAYSIAHMLEQKNTDGTLKYTVGQVQKELGIKKGQYYRLKEWVDNERDKPKIKVTKKT